MLCRVMRNIEKEKDVRVKPIQGSSWDMGVRWHTEQSIWLVNRSSGKERLRLRNKVLSVENVEKV